MEILIIYSNYSKKCKKFMSALNKDPIIDVNKINKLCIDNPSIRNVVAKHIKVVPAIMVKNDQDIDLYEGDEAYEWLDSFAEQLYSQLESIEEKKQAEINARIQAEAEAKAIEIAKQLQQHQKQKQQKVPSPTTNKNVKQQAKIIANDRTTKLDFQDEQPDIAAHVSQVKSVSDVMSISEQVKNMEKEREIEEREIKKRLQTGMGGAQ